MPVYEDIILDVSMNVRMERLMESIRDIDLISENLRDFTESFVKKGVIRVNRLGRALNRIVEQVGVDLKGAWLGSVGNIDILNKTLEGGRLTLALIGRILTEIADEYGQSAAVADRWNRAMVGINAKLNMISRATRQVIWQWRGWARDIMITGFLLSISQFVLWGITKRVDRLLLITREIRAAFSQMLSAALIPIDTIISGFILALMPVLDIVYALLESPLIRWFSSILLILILIGAFIMRNVGGMLTLIAPTLTFSHELLKGALAGDKVSKKLLTAIINMWRLVGLSRILEERLATVARAMAVQMLSPLIAVNTTLAETGSDVDERWSALVGTLKAMDTSFQKIDDDLVIVGSVGAFERVGDDIQFVTFGLDKMLGELDKSKGTWTSWLIGAGGLKEAVNNYVESIRKAWSMKPEPKIKGALEKGFEVSLGKVIPKWRTYAHRLANIFNRLFRREAFKFRMFEVPLKTELGVQDIYLALRHFRGAMRSWVKTHAYEYWSRITKVPMEFKMPKISVDEKAGSKITRMFSGVFDRIIGRLNKSFGFLTERLGSQRWLQSFLSALQWANVQTGIIIRQAATEFSLLPFRLKNVLAALFRPLVTYGRWIVKGLKVAGRYLRGIIGGLIALFSFSQAFSTILEVIGYFADMVFIAMGGNKIIEGLLGALGAISNLLSSVNPKFIKFIIGIVGVLFGLALLKSALSGLIFTLPALVMLFNVVIYSWLRKVAPLASRLAIALIGVIQGLMLFIVALKWAALMEIFKNIPIVGYALASALAVGAMTALGLAFTAPPVPEEMNRQISIENVNIYTESKEGRGIARDFLFGLESAGVYH